MNIFSNDNLRPTKRKKSSCVNVTVSMVCLFQFLKHVLSHISNANKNFRNKHSNLFKSFRNVMFYYNGVYSFATGSLMQVSHMLGKYSTKQHILSFFFFNFWDSVSPWLVSLYSSSSPLNLPASAFHVAGIPGPPGLAPGISSNWT